MDTVGARDVLEVASVVSVTMERIRALDWDRRGGRAIGRPESGLEALRLSAPGRLTRVDIEVCGVVALECGIRDEVGAVLVDSELTGFVRRGNDDVEG